MGSNPFFLVDIMMMRSPLASRKKHAISGHFHATTNDMKFGSLLDWCFCKII